MIFFDRLVVPSEEFVDVSQAGVGVGGIRVELGGAEGVPETFLGLAGLSEGEAQELQGIGVVGVAGEDLAEERLGLGQIAGVLAAEGGFEEVFGGEFGHGTGCSSRLDDTLYRTGPHPIVPKLAEGAGSAPPGYRRRGKRKTPQVA